MPQGRQEDSQQMGPSMDSHLRMEIECGRVLGQVGWYKKEEQKKIVINLDQRINEELGFYLTHPFLKTALHDIYK